MNFGKAKKILIFLFAFLNLFLIFQLSRISSSKTSVSHSSIKQTINLVSARGLKVDEQTVPRRIELLSFLELSNPLYDKQQFSSEINSYKSINVDYNLFNIEYEGQNFKTEKELLKFFNKTGFSTYSLKFINKISNPITSEEIYFFNQSYNSHPIYGSSLNATLKKESITSASGNLYKIESVKMNDYTPVSPLQILLSLSRSLNGKIAEVKEIEQGYFIPNESQHYQNLTAIPCYILSVNSCKFIYDAEKGEFMQCIFEDSSSTADIESAISVL